MRNFAHAARPLVNDLFSSLLFAILLAIGVDALAATVIAMVAGVAHVLLMAALRRSIAPLQWASLALVLAFGTASLFLHDPRFLMAKPTVIYAILAVVMLKRGWMLRYMPPIAGKHGERPMIAFGYVWAGLLALTGAANLIVAIWFSAYWPLYKAVFPIASKLMLFGAQYLHMQRVVKPRVIARLAETPQEQAA
jgi:intracellular septation protein